MIDKKILDLLPCSIYWEDLIGVCCGCNQAMVDAFGFDSSDQCIGKSLFDLLSTEEAERIRQVDEEVIRSGKGAIVEERATIRGESRVFLSRKIPLRDPQGEVVGLLGATFDVSDFYAAEQAAIKKQKAAEDALNKIINVLPGHVYWYDLDGTIYGMNDQQARSLGLSSAAEAIGKNGYSLVPEKYANAWREVNESVVHAGKIMEMEEIFYYPDGHEGTVLSKKAPWYNEQGEAIGVIGVSLDITEEKNLGKQLEIAKLNAESTLEGIIAMLPGNVYWQDKNDVILGCNESAAQLAGFKSNLEVIGKTNRDMPWKEMANSIIAVNRQVMESGQTLTAEEMAVSVDHKEAVFLSKKAPLRNKKGEIIGTIGVSFDISAQKEAESLKLKALITEEKMETMRLLAASIAHELRTPLGSIRVETESFAQALPALLEAYELAKTCNLPVKPLPLRRLKGMQEAISVIKEETVYANTIINMLLTNIQEPTVQPKEMEILSLQKCIAQALKRYPFVSEEQASLVHLDPSVDFEVNGVELLLEHLLFNLFRNSLYFIEAVGKGEIYIWLKKGEVENIMYFKDTGKGIAPEIIERVFDRFVGTRHHGTGVGLAFCKEVMVEHRGTIACESVVGEYALFTLTFPLGSII